jgi:hypothetical protein
MAREGSGLAHRRECLGETTDANAGLERARDDAQPRPSGHVAAQQRRSSSSRMGATARRGSPIP